MEECNWEHQIFPLLTKIYMQEIRVGHPGANVPTVSLMSHLCGSPEQGHQGWLGYCPITFIAEGVVYMTHAGASLVRLALALYIYIPLYNLLPAAV